MMQCFCLVLTVIVTVAQLRGVHGSSDGAEPTQEFVVHQSKKGERECKIVDRIGQ